MKSKEEFRPFWKRGFCLFFILLGASLWGQSIVLINDAPFELTAVVQAANGKVLEEITIPAGSQAHWTTDRPRTYLDLPDVPSVSLTPFTVLWKCSYEGYYSICTNVSPGAFVRANECDGGRICIPKPPKETPPPCPSPCPPCVCPN